VLAESYSRGWRAWCRSRDGHEYELGPSQPIDGFGNGWRIDDANCTRTRFAYAPQTSADVGYWISAIAAIVLLALFAVAGLLRRFGGSLQAVSARAPQPTATSTTRRLGWVPAAVTGVVVGVGAVALSDSVAGILAGALAFAVARLGASSTRMYALAAFAVALALLDYLIAAPASSVIDIDFVHGRLAGHWLALAAMVALAVGAALEVAALRRQSEAPPPGEKAALVPPHPVGSKRRNGSFGLRRRVVTWLWGGSSSRS
jgi:hypothetical protein